MARNSAKRRKIWAGVYTVFLGLYAIALAAGAVFVLTKVWEYAEEYENARPEPVIDAYVADLRKNLWGEGIERTLAEMPHEAQSDQDVAVIVKNMLSNEISYSRQTAENSGSSSIVYNLRCGDRVFGKVVLEEDQSQANHVKYGMLPWTVASEEFDFTGLYSSMTITVPSTFTVKLNDWELTDEYIVESGIQFDSLKDYYDKYPSLPTKVTYEFDNIIGSLEPVVYDEEGNEFTIDPAKDDSQFIRTMQPGEQLSRLEEFANEFTERYRTYITGVNEPAYGYQRLAAYMILDSDLDERMYLLQDGLSWSHTAGVRIDWVTLNSAIDIGDGYYILDISSQAHAYHPGQGEFTNLQSMKVIVLDAGGEIRAAYMDLYEDTDVEDTQQPQQGG